LAFRPILTNGLAAGKALAFSMSNTKRLPCQLLSLLFFMGFLLSCFSGCKENRHRHKKKPLNARFSGFLGFAGWSVGRFLVAGIE
jgi:hypothetical protein